MGTNYYFRKKSIDTARLESIVDNLNRDTKALMKKYNAKLQKAFSDMGIDGYYEFEANHSYDTYYFSKDLYGDVHVGKLSCGWKPLMQANEHFNSLQTLKQWYEKNKHDYDFIDCGQEIRQFDEYIEEIHKRNQDDDLRRHDRIQRSDGYDWEYEEFS